MAHQNSSKLDTKIKATVFWGDILYDTAMCSPNEPITVGKDEKNTLMLDIDHLSFTKDMQSSSGLGPRKSLELVRILDDGSALVQFDDMFSGHLKIGSELLSLASAKKTKHVSQNEKGYYQAKLGKADKADFSIGHVSIYLDWAGNIEVIPRDDKKSKVGLLIFAAALLGLTVVAILSHVVEAEPEPERIVVLLPPKPVAAKAAMGEKKSADGGAQKGDAGKAQTAPPVKETAASSLAKANLGSLVSGLTSLGSNAPTTNAATKTAAVEQQGTGGFTTEGLKKGAGGKSVGIGRTVGQGEGGFGGTGRLGLSGNSAVEGGTGYGTTDTQVRGGLDPDVIESVIKRRLDRIRLCYERELNFHPKLSGKVSINFQIGPQGQVLSAKLAEDTMKSSNVNSCILGEVKSWTFPKPEGGTVVNVDYPFVFESSAHAN
ncbi:MAG: AgmX/PglI C-terminal domain-containing protein [Bacteriovoracia bacterium]